jgi:hypothetical protein
MNPIMYILALALGGTLLAAMYTFVVGLAGAPGALLTLSAMRRADSNTIPTWGLLLTLVGQLYASLAFAAFIVLNTAARLQGVDGIWRWITWGVAFFVALAPASMALKDAAHAEVKNVQHGAATLTAPLTAIGFVVFVVVPSVLQAGWGWVPHF